MNFIKALLAFVILTATFGCGGPHVTGSDPAASGSSSAGSSTQAVDDDCVGENCAPANPVQPEQAVVPTPASEATQQNGNVTVDVGVQAPAVPAPVNGINGINGRDGRDACIVSYSNKEFDASSTPLTDLVALENENRLPYLTLDARNHRRLRVISLNQGFTNGGNSNYGCLGGSSANCGVHNAMVVFNVDLELPARNLLVTNALPFDAKLKVKYMKKFTTEHRFDDTEILCLLNNQTCSGKYFLNPAQERAAGHTPSSFDWSTMINQNFNGGNAVVNTYFSEELRLAGAPGSGRRIGRLYTVERNFDLKQLFGLANKEALMNLLYGDNSTEALEKTLQFVIADDILVLEAKLVMDYSVNTCDVAQRPVAAAPVAAEPVVAPAPVAPAPVVSTPEAQPEAVVAPTPATEAVNVAPVTTSSSSAITTITVTGPNGEQHTETSTAPVQVRTYSIPLSEIPAPPPGF